MLVCGIEDYKNRKRNKKIRIAEFTFQDIARMRDKTNKEKEQRIFNLYFFFFFKTDFFFYKFKKITAHKYIDIRKKKETDTHKREGGYT